ncbi:hypothetical protein CQ012_02275 [Arthrobacter sp. MYb214]|uniref:hypothetical protein n=1 Tax=Arthrobacter sp. MYb214 TaxID=1848596 RepID=UPI000CFE2CD5|nr:hypothetical protein [Arthrobacter sp. MYb214]PRB78236.1 hypothetical protein CQ012_02275 [Arthrobacter sp. MYb214]
MTKKRNLAKSNLKSIPKQIRAQRYATPQNGSAIGRKGLRVYDGGWIRIENGGLEVTGTAFITGRLISNGENIFNGTTEMNGPTTVAGDFEIVAGGQFKAGDSIINPDGSAQFGGLDISPDGTLEAGQFKLNPDGSADFGTLGIDADGVLTVRNDVNVEEGGEINVGTNMTLTPSADGGSISFQDGSRVTSVAGTVQVKSSASGIGFTAGLNTASIGAGPTGAIMAVDDAGDWVMQGSKVSVQSSGDTIAAIGNLDISKELSVGEMASAPSGAVANVYWNSTTKQLMVAL